MVKFILRWVINAVALYVAVSVIPGIHLQNPSWLSIIWMALIFGFVNAVVGPLLKFLTCGLIILTLGLFTLIINAALLALSSWIGLQFGVGITFSDPWWWNVFLGSLVITVISLILSLVLKDELKKK